MTTEDTSPSYRLEVAAPVFPVTDVKRALRYYTGALAFDVGFEWADAPDEAVNYVILHNGNCELHVSHSGTARPTVAYFFVDGVAAYHAAVAARGANITCPIEDHPWDMREFEVTDPDGNRLIFGEHLSRIPDQGA